MHRNNKAFIEWVIIGGMFIALSIGLIVPAVTKKPDTPLEQIAEQYIFLQTGETVDFSARLKKTDEGKVLVENVQVDKVEQQH